MLERTSKELEELVLEADAELKKYRNLLLEIANLENSFIHPDSSSVLIDDIEVTSTQVKKNLIEVTRKEKIDKLNTTIENLISLARDVNAGYNFKKTEEGEV